MTNNPIKQSFESISPTEEQKKRMLTHILQKTQEQPTPAPKSETQPQPKVIPLSRKARPYLAVAASLVIVVLGAMTLTQIEKDPISNSPEISQEMQGNTQVVIYNNTTYTYTEELTDLSPEHLIGPLDTLDEDIIWQLKEHDPEDAIVLEHLGKYYLCKKIN